MTTAREMEAAVHERIAGASIAIATAAVADWRPAVAHEQKVKKTDDVAELALERNPDILAELGERKNACSWSALPPRPSRSKQNAREKLRANTLDAIAVNDVGGERGFGTGENALVLLWGDDGRRDLGRGSKRELAAQLWDAIVERKNGAGR